MTVDLYRIFLASPGGLEEEHQLIREEIEIFNETTAIPLGALFRMVGWETVAGGTGRPQGLINEYLEICDYFIVVLWHRWGSAPAGSSYSSGTEEEFNEAKKYKDREGKPMTDLVVYFKTKSPPQLTNIVGHDIERINKFREGLDSLLYKAFEEREELRNHLRMSLSKWLFKRKNVVGGYRDTPSPALASGSTQALRPFADPATSSALLESNAAVGLDHEPSELRVQAENLSALGRLSEAHDVYDRLLSGKYGRDWEIDAYLGIGDLCLRRGQPDRAIEQFRAAARMAKALETKPMEAQALYLLGKTLYEQQSPRLARPPLVEAERIAEGANGPFGLGETRNLLGLVCLDLGNNGEAQRCFQRAVNDYRTAGRSDGEAKGLNNIGLLHLLTQNLPAAKEALTKALEINAARQFAQGIAVNHFNLGRVARLQSNDDEARTHFNKANDLYNSNGFTADALNVQAELAKLPSVEAGKR
jgi:tetratricopeptide (TPR) repeat protein